jgi:maltose/moltooligosaccharide transporter
VVYTVPAVTQHIYGTTDTTSEAYNTGANQVGEMFANYNLMQSFFLLPLLKIYRSNSHFVARGLGLMSVYFITEPTVFTMAVVGVGIMGKYFIYTLCHVIRLTAI